MTGSAALLYLDTSALARLYTKEPQHEIVRAHVNAATDLVTHLLTYTEMRAALASRLARKAMTKRAYTTALRDFENDWEHYARVAVDERLARDAGELAERRGLRAFDAVHLAAALTLRPLGVRFLTFDAQLRQAAQVELPGLVLSV